MDLTTGSGLDEALAGVDAVIDASNVTALRAKPAIKFFEAATGLADGGLLTGDGATILPETYDHWLAKGRR